MRRSALQNTMEHEVSNTTKLYENIDQTIRQSFGSWAEVTIRSKVLATETREMFLRFEMYGNQDFCKLPLLYFGSMGPKVKVR